MRWLVLWGAGCVAPGPEEMNGIYEFTSRFTDGSSVDYSGQVVRQLLLHDLVEYAEALTGRVDTGYFPTEGEVEAGLSFYLDFDSTTAGSLPHDFTSDPPPAQGTYDDVATGKSLVEKIAGNDPEGQHRDWSTEFRGWTPGATPEGLVRTWFAEIDGAAVARAAGDVPLGPDGDLLSSVTLSADGLERAELLPKFLYGALMLSQAADDYLDDATPGAGLLSPNDAPSEEGSAYTVLEHAWDEAFGYFGIARDALSWDEALLAEDGYADTFTPDGAIDLQSEVSWAVARYAAQRDLAAVVPTDFTTAVVGAFIDGRALIQRAGGDLDDAALDELRALRDQALSGWEAVLAASAVHYVNETLQDMGKFGTADYQFSEHAEHWSELKGLLLAFQFNPRSAVDATTFDALHAAVGLAPVLSTADPAAIEAYRAALVEARTTLGDRFGFPADNLGDADGANGW